MIRVGSIAEQISQMLTVLFILLGIDHTNKGYPEIQG